MTTKLRPLGDRLVLRRIDAPDYRSAGIRMPDAAAEDQTSQECEVVAVGASVTGDAALLQVGDRVYIAKHKGYGVTTNGGEELVVVEAVDVLCIEQDNDATNEEVPF